MIECLVLCLRKMKLLWVVYEVESTVIGCSLNDNYKLIECKKVGLQQVKFKWPPYVKVWFMPTNWLAKTMSKILSPKMCEVIITKWHQSLHQWTHDIGMPINGKCPNIPYPYELVNGIALNK